VGGAYLASGYSHAFLYSGGAMSDLGVLSGGKTSEAYSINESGQVAGTSNNTSGNWRAFVYSGGAMTDLGTFGGSMATAYAINDAGDVVGALTFPAISTTHLYGTRDHV